MSRAIRNLKPSHEPEPLALGQYIHAHVRAAIEQAVDEELALGACPWQRTEERPGYRNGSRPRTLTALVARSSSSYRLRMKRKAGVLGGVATLQP